MKKTILFLLLLCFTSQVGAYEFNWKEYKIEVPENIAYYEYALMTNDCSLEIYSCKVAKLNILLVTRWFKPLY